MYPKTSTESWKPSKPAFGLSQPDVTGRVGSSERKIARNFPTRIPFCCSRTSFPALQKMKQFSEKLIAELEQVCGEGTVWLR